MFLLDTNVISEQLRSAPSKLVLNWLNEQPLEILFLSSMTVAELRAGIALMPEGKRQEALRDNIEHKILPLFIGRILPFNHSCSKAYAEVISTSKRNGSGIATADAIIASTAKEASLTVATRDTNPFLAAEIKVINPWEVL